ncbi:dipeptide ABC transporter ATP-binding protein [Jatrophihabitans sp.]|uniref:ABC transporter ATP-binding protein n=1 Tax=Jatrophihabitans sp. TaxID=1932789 RepID=UPI002D09AE87|nr:ABC transporter ATP-binding protein [Jatrophihabitans sp.]
MTVSTTSTSPEQAATRPGGPLLEVSDLTVSFGSEAGAVRAVRGVSYTVRPGETLAIVGESGSGKSVSSLAVMGLLPSNAVVTGSIRFKGTEMLGMSDRKLSRLRGSGISMVFQDPLSALTPVYTIGDQIAEAVRIHQDVSKSQAHQRAVELLDLVGIPNPRLRSGSFPHEFSGGMRQRAMIAMAIANDPDLIIADEPTTALDVTIQAQVLDVLAKAKEATNAATVLITHDLGVVAGFADRVMVMYAGKAVELATVDDVFYAPRMPYTMGLLGSIPRMDVEEKEPLIPIEGTPPSLVNLPSGCPFRPRCPLAVDVCRTTEPELVDTDRPQHRAACHRSLEIAQRQWSAGDVFSRPQLPVLSSTLPPRREEREVVLALDDVHRTFPIRKGAVIRRTIGQVRAVDGVSLDIRQGETLGLVGESGCGKTTTIMEVMNLLKPQQGNIVVLGRDTSDLKAAERRRMRAELSIVFQDPMASLDPRMPIGDILAEPMWVQKVPEERIKARTAELLKMVGLAPEHASRYPAEFSGGQRQRIGIARALALDPKVIVLDEPVSALDVSIQAGVINLLDELKARMGLSYLFVAHDLSVVRHIADRVAVMYLGRIVEIGTTREIFTAPSHPYTQALLSAIPLPDPIKERSRKRILLSGDLPSPADVPSGCRFSSRCFVYAEQLSAEEQATCKGVDPGLYELGGDHRAACHFAKVREVV